MKRLFILIPFLLFAGCDNTSQSNPPSKSSQNTPTVSTNKNELEITKSTFKGVYPFIVEKGLVKCEKKPNEINFLYFVVDSNKYPLTGISKQKDSPDITKIWADNPQAKGSKLPLDDVIKQANALCQN